MKRTFFYALYTWLRRLCNEVGDMKEIEAEAEGFMISDYLLLLQICIYIKRVFLADVAPGLLLNR